MFLYILKPVLAVVEALLLEIKSQASFGIVIKSPNCVVVARHSIGAV